MAGLASQLVVDNGFAGSITVVHSALEDIQELPGGTSSRSIFVARGISMPHSVVQLTHCMGCGQALSIFWCPNGWASVRTLHAPIVPRESMAVVRVFHAVRACFSC